MKILFWTELFWPYIGGIEVLCQQLISTLQKRSYEFLVVTSHGDLDLADMAWHEDIPIHRFHFLHALLYRDMRLITDIRRRLGELRRAYQPDLVHLNTGFPSLFFHQHTAAAFPAPTLYTMHSPLEVNSEQNSLLVRTLQSADWVTAVSDVMRQDVCRLVPELEPRSTVIYNALDIPSVEPGRLSFDPPRLLCVGRLVHDKGFDLAIEAFAQIIERFPRARLVIAGDGEARPDLERQAADLKIQDSVEFMGWIAPDQVPTLLNSATVVVMPSRWREPFGLVALQAAQMARPIVATRVGGLPEVVAHEQTGLLVDSEDSLALSESITRLIDDPVAATQMGQAARRRAREVFSYTRFVDAYDSLYQKLARD